MKILFVCNQNKHRSKTAENIFRNKFYTKSAGLFNENPMTEKQVHWADVVVVMEDFQRTEISRRFPKEYIKKRIISLDVPDIYHYNQPDLINVLKSRMKKLL
ncbi:phosphotyrosine protein phosphatase [Candidatus Woesearchaeota archaeon]|nr:phosphotyrosine protein phosphatase [Candidatus Woesearchaeota archaeon]